MKIGKLCASLIANVDLTSRYLLPLQVNNTALIIRTSKGYLTEIDVITGQIKQGYISHTNDTCTLVDGNYYVYPQLYKQIMKYSLSNGNDFFGYIDVSSDSIVTPSYDYMGGDCRNMGGSTTLIKLIENIETVTGVKQVYTLPITINK